MKTPEFPPIQQRLMEFIRDHFQPGYNHYNVVKLLGDASSRQYYRYFTDDEHSYILAAYPESFDRSRFTYKQIYDLLQKIEIPVPDIIAMDGKRGIVLQQDLGDESLQKTLRAAADRQRTLLLREALDHIVLMQEEGTRAFLPEYEGHQLAFDREKLLWEFHFFAKHYLGNYRKLTLPDRDALESEFESISEELASYPRVFCHRDFHVRNMMVMNGLLYVIDFQDARWGPPSYDVASLLKDSLELEEEQVEDLLGHYLEAVERRDFLGLPPESFRKNSFLRQFHLMTIQRLLKALGTYAYQIIVRENFIYEQYMAGSLHRALLALNRISEFPTIRQLVETELQRRNAVPSRAPE